jgi:cold-inducible RNA-binding protein
MAKKLYVSNLPYKINSDSLGELFAQAGAVASAEVVLDRESGRSRGFGFVEFDNDAEADAAIEMFNEQEIEGRKLIVNEARPREERPRRPGGDRRF